jgi:transcriptional regulator with XRE-family HTH domain
VTLLPPLKHIRTLKLAKLSKLPTTELPTTEFSTAELSIPDPQPEPAIESDLAPLEQTPGEILHQIGTRLRQWREYYGWSIEDVSAKTQLQPRLIQAIEAGDIELLPEPVYVKGMVKRYGDHLGLNGAGIAQNIPTWQRQEETQFTQTSLRTTSFGTPYRLKPFHLYLGYILLIVGGGAGISHLINEAFRPKLAIVAPTVATNIRQPAMPAPTAVVTPPQSVNIGITVKNPVWAQIGIDGIVKFTGNLQVGTQLNWAATKQVTISTNNAGALMLSRDRQPPQPVGKLGEKQQVTIKIGM